MRVVVMGAGAHFARALLPALCGAREIESVTAIDAAPAACAHAKLRTVASDAQEIDLAGMLREHEALVHLTQPDDARCGLEGAVRAAHRLFHEAHAAGVQRLVHMSTAAVYGSAVHANESSPLRPLAGFPYAQLQAQLEQLLAIDLPHCVRLRPHLMVGPHAHTAVKRLLRVPFYPRFPEGEPLFQCVHESDLASAVLLALTTEARGAYNLATEESFTVREAIRARHLFALPLPLSAARTALGVAGRMLARDLAPVWLERASHTLTVNCRRAVIELGWRRRYSAREALAIT